MTADLPTLSIIIPTLNAAGDLPELLRALQQQTAPPLEIILVDSESDDGTPGLAARSGCRVIPISRSSFRHGRARNLGAASALGQVLVFLTQDALPANPRCLEELVRPLSTAEAQAATARQIAPPQASPLEQFARAFNYPPVSTFHRMSDLPSLGVKAFFFSNTASAVTAQSFHNLGGFSEQVIVNEDMHFCARLLRSGGTAAYTARAEVLHAHQYSLRGLFGRYFDIGVFFRNESDVLQGAHTGGEGLSFVRDQIRFLAKKGAWGWILAALAQTVVKAAGFWLGKHYQRLPFSLRRAFSSQKAYWK